MLMPTYVCYLPRDRFDTEQKARIAGPAPLHILFR